MGSQHGWNFVTFVQRVLELRAGRGLWEGCRTQTRHGLTLMEGLCLSSPQVLVLGSPRLQLPLVLQVVAPEGHDQLPRVLSSKDCVFQGLPVFMGMKRQAE